MTPESQIIHFMGMDLGARYGEQQKGREENGDSLIRPESKEIAQGRNRSLDFPNYMIGKTTMCLAMSHDYYIGSWELSD